MNRAEVMALPPGNAVRRALERDENAERIRRKMTPAEWAEAMAGARTRGEWNHKIPVGPVDRKGNDRKIREALAPAARPGEATEAMLFRQLEDAAFTDVLHLAEHPRPERVFVPQYAWGWHLTPSRGFHSDFAFPAARLLVEIDGGAHAAGRAKVARDVKRRGLAAAAGWRLLSVTPAQVRDAEAVPLVLKALGIA